MGDATSDPAVAEGAPTSSTILRRPGGCERLAVRPSGDLFALACNDGQVVILGAQDLEPRSRVVANVGVGYAVAWHPEGNQLLAVGAGGRVALIAWDDATSEATVRDVVQIPGATSLWDVAWEGHEGKGDATAAWIVGYGRIAKVVANTTTVTVESVFQVEGNCYGVAVRPTAGGGRRVLAVGSQQWKVERRGPVPSSMTVNVTGAAVDLRSIALDPATGYVAAVGAVDDSSRLLVWRGGQVLSDEPVVNAELDSPSWQCDVRSEGIDGQRKIVVVAAQLRGIAVAVTLDEGGESHVTARLTASADGDDTSNAVRGDEPPCYGVALLTCSTFCSSTADGRARLWDIEGDQFAPRGSAVPVGAGCVWTSVSWRPATDGRPSTFAFGTSGGDVGCASITPSGVRVTAIERGHWDWADDVQWSEDGRYLLSHGHDGSLARWTLSEEGGLTRRSLAGCERRPVAFAPDGQSYVAMQANTPGHPDAPTLQETPVVEELTGSPPARHMADSDHSPHPVWRTVGPGPAVVRVSGDTVQVFARAKRDGALGEDDRRRLGDGLRTVDTTRSGLIVVGSEGGRYVVVRRDDDGRLDVAADHRLEPVPIWSIAAGELSQQPSIFLGTTRGQVHVHHLDRDLASLGPPEVLYEAPEGQTWCRDLSLSPDGRHLVACFNGSMVVIDLGEDDGPVRVQGPLVPNRVATQDSLGRQGLIDALAAQLPRHFEADSDQVGSTDMLVLIDAPWGMGKTTFLELLRPKLSERRWLWVRANAWTLERGGLSWRALTTELERAVAREASPWMKGWLKLRGWASVATGMKATAAASLVVAGTVAWKASTYPADALTTPRLAIAASVLAGIGTFVLAMTAFITLFAASRRTRVRFRPEADESVEATSKEMRHLRRYVGRVDPKEATGAAVPADGHTAAAADRLPSLPYPVQGGSGAAPQVPRRSRLPRKHIVVAIEDLDRCSPEFVVDFLSATWSIRAMAETTRPGAARICFFVPADRRYLQAAADSVRPEFSAALWEHGIDHSNAFLDKIFDLQVRIPPPSNEALGDFARHVTTDDAQVRP